MRLPAVACARQLYHKSQSRYRREWRVLPNTAGRPKNESLTGIQVLCAVILPALVVLVLITCYYILYIRENADGLCTRLDRAALECCPKSIPGSRWLTEKILRDVRSPSTEHRVLRAMGTEKLSQIILLFSDIQLVNGFATLVSGYILGCSISNYHWQILVECVWFASATHLATLPVLRSYLAEAGMTWLVWIRASLMTVILAMLVVSLVPTGHPEWLNLPGMPAWCYFDYSYDDNSAYVDPLNPDSSDPASVTSAWGAVTEVLLLAWSVGLLSVTYLRRGVQLLRPWPTTSESQTTQQTSHTERNPEPAARQAFANWCLMKWRDRVREIEEAQNKLYDPESESLLQDLIGLPVVLTLRTMRRLFESFLWHVSGQILLGYLPLLIRLLSPRLSGWPSQ